eukprot:TRINITY_DN7039_c0_g1_i1.p2 TRINITY_DN7039_c0_g1~~TRINITY_DN7039_c0_g1_i1.p2  ORF type:complete len:216 (+),score=117.73 TRINITY_DN7039_c0_g1_i1:86-649(+)
MVRIDPCSFCSAPVYPGHGMTFVRNDCKVFKFCASKCHKNFKLKRTPRKTKWTKTFRKAAGKEMDMDTTLDFERKRNVPIKYNRELMATTLRVMEQVQRIKERRERAFWERRMKVKVETDTAAELKDLKTHLHRIEDPAVKETAKEALKTADAKKAKERRAKAGVVRRKKQRQKSGGAAAAAGADED